MSLPNLLQYGVFLLIVIALVRPLGGYMTRVFERERTWLDFLLRPVEQLIYKLTGVVPTVEMNWTQYAVSLVVFSFTGTVLLYLILRLQYLLSWYDAAHLTTPLTPDLAMNTAVSFSTTTTWQAYGGETTISYFSQLAGLAAQNLPAYTFTFGVLVVGAALIVGGLSYFPALALGPIIEHLLMNT